MCMLLIISAMTTILYTNNTTVKASGGDSNGVGLDYNFMWNVTKNLSNMIYTSYPGNVIRKGRMFGTPGEQEAAYYFYHDIMTQSLNLENVRELQLGPIEDNKDWYYTSKIDILDYNLTINQPDYPYPKRLPYNESFAWPSGCKNIISEFGDILSMNYNHSFSNVRLLNRSINESWDLFGGQFTGQYYNVTNCSMVNGQSIIIGNVSYVENVCSLPDDQEGRVFLIDKKDGCEEILENISEPSTAIFMDDGSKYSVNQSVINNCSCQIAQVNKNETNLTTVINTLKNGTVMIADNYYHNQTISFTYGFDDILVPWWPDHDFFILIWISENNLSKLMVYTDIIWIANSIVHKWADRGLCHGVIYYGSNANTHEMNGATRDWRGFSTDRWAKENLFPRPGLQMVSVNQSVGQWLAVRADNSSTTVSGFINQTYYEEDHSGDPSTWTAGVTAYNVEGNITTTNNPTNAIVICSNRYDSMAAECPGDSGAGAGICLSIAKYMMDNNITPKYNITFLEDTGEEYGFRGAWHYNHSHPPGQSPGQYNIIRWIGFDQLGFNHESGPLDLGVRINNQSNSYYNESQIISAIANDSDLGYAVHPEWAKPGSGVTEDIAWLTRPNCKTICFEKNNPWRYHHETGMNFMEGDSMKNMNRSELNKTLDFAWLVMKYYTVNPDCWFDSVSHEAWNTSGGTAPDSIKASFTVKSILPSDLIRVNASLYDASTGLPVPNASQELDFVINRTGIERALTVTMPSDVKEDDYYLKLEVYNSTARINRTLGFSNYTNDTITSPTFHLNKYHTLGDIRIGTSSVSVHDNITGSQFTLTEYAKVHNITAYLYGTSYPSSPTYQGMIYRYSDGHLIANTSLVMRNQTGWYTFTFTPEPVLLKNTAYVLAIWGNNNQSKIYSTYQLPANAYYNRSYTFGSPPPENITWDDPLTSQQSIFCQYTLDTTPPEIINVLHSPDTVGYGFNVTITADVTDDVSGVDQVTVQITSPNGFSIGNNTMTHLGGDTFQYVSTNQWALGEYNYTIWAVDNMNRVNSSAGHHFHVSVNASISIATLQDTYTADEYINITDPPNPPEDLTLVGRGLTWNKYYNDVMGQNILKVSTMPINYQDDNDTWTPINTTLNQLPSNHPAYVIGYRKGNDRGLYGLYFKTNAQQEWPVAFTYNRSDDPTIYAVRSKLMGVGYVDPANNWSYEYLQSVQSSQGQTTGNTITYEDVFTGTDVTWSYDTTGLKEEIILSNATKIVLQNHPPSQYGLNNASSYLVFITKLDYQNLDLYNESGMIPGNVTVSDADIEFKEALEQFRCSLPLGEAYELNNVSARETLTYRIIHLNGNTYLLTGLRVSDLSTMTFPVIIDPTIKVYPTTSDGHISNSSTSYNTAWTATTGAISSTSTTFSIGQQPPGIFPTYYIYRGYLFFDTTTLPSNAYIDNATLGLYKSNDYSTTDFLITVQNGQPTYPHDPLETGDYGKNLYSGNGGVINTSGLVNGYNNITLNSDGRSWLNRTGLTKLCLRSNRDINGNTPTNNEYVKVYASEQGEGYEPLLTITYRNQSKIKNTGSTTFKGYLLIQVQYDDSGTWVVDNDLVNETSPRTITILDQLALDQIFNGMLKASELHHGNGTYRVYTAFRDPNGAILRTETVSGGRIGSAELKAWWEFIKT
jgi:hypothetical protein